MKPSILFIFFLLIAFVLACSLFSCEVHAQTQIFVVDSHIYGVGTKDKLHPECGNCYTFDDSWRTFISLGNSCGSNIITEYRVNANGKDKVYLKEQEVKKAEYLIRDLMNISDAKSYNGLNIGDTIEIPIERTDRLHSTKVQVFGFVFQDKDVFVRYKVSNTRGTFHYGGESIERVTRVTKNKI